MHPLIYRRLPTRDWYRLSWSGASSSSGSFDGLNSVIVYGNDFVGIFVIGRSCSFARFPIKVFCISFTDFLSHDSSILGSFFGIPSLSSSTCCAIAISMSFSCFSVGAIAIISST